MTVNFDRMTTRNGITGSVVYWVSICQITFITFRWPSSSAGGYCCGI